MPESIPEYYRHLAEESGEESGPEHGMDSKEDSGDEEPDSQDAPSEPTVYRADAFRLRLPKGEWQDGSAYVVTGPDIRLPITKNATA